MSSAKLPYWKPQTRIPSEPPSDSVLIRRALSGTTSDPVIRNSIVIVPSTRISSANGAPRMSESEKSMVRASVPVTSAVNSGRSARICFTTSTPSWGSSCTSALQPPPRSSGAATASTLSILLTCCAQASASASLSVTSSTRGLAANGNSSCTVVTKVYCVDDSGVTSTLVLAMRSDRAGAASARSTRAAITVMMAGWRCTRRVSREKKPSVGAMSPKRRAARPSSGMRVKSPGRRNLSPLTPMSAGMRVRADAIATMVTARAPTPIARTMRGSKASSATEAAAKVMPE